TTGHVPTVAIEDDDMPGPEVIAVVALVPVAGGRSEICEVPACTGRPIVVVAHRGSGACFLTPPRLVVAGVVAGGAGIVGIVAQGEHGPGNGVEERSGGEMPVGGTTGDVAGANQGDRPRRRSRRRCRRSAPRRGGRRRGGRRHGGRCGARRRDVSRGGRWVRPSEGDRNGSQRHDRLVETRPAHRTE